jgi:hypothetical protein
MRGAVAPGYTRESGDAAENRGSRRRGLRPRFALDRRAGGLATDHRALLDLLAQPWSAITVLRALCCLLLAFHYRAQLSPERAWSEATCGWRLALSNPRPPRETRHYRGRDATADAAPNLRAACAGSWPAPPRFCIPPAPQSPTSFRAGDLSGPREQPVLAVNCTAIFRPHPRGHAVCRGCRNARRRASVLTGREPRHDDSPATTPGFRAMPPRHARSNL